MNTGSLVVPLLIGSGAYASWSDWRFRRIPNALCLSLAGLGLLLAVLGEGSLAALSQLGHAGLALVAGLALFSFGVFGGGDAKYYAAVAACIPISAGAKLLGSVSLGGLVLVAIWHAASWLKPALDSRSGDFAKLPFGVAIAIGGVAAAWSVQ